MRSDDQIPARRHSLGPVETYEIEKQQFMHIEHASTAISVPLAASFALIPVAVTLSVTLATAGTMEPHKEAILWGSMFAFYIGGIVCGIFAFVKRGELKQYMQDIRENQVAPVAAKGASTTPDLTAVSDPDASTTLVSASEQPGEEVNDAL